MVTGTPEDKSRFWGNNFKFFLLFCIPSSALCNDIRHSSIRSTTILGEKEWLLLSGAVVWQRICWEHPKLPSPGSWAEPLQPKPSQTKPNQALTAKAFSLRPSHTLQQPECSWAPGTVPWSSEAAVWGCGVDVFWFYLCFHQRPHNSVHFSSRAVESTSLLCQRNSSNWKCKLNPPLWCKALLSGVPQTSRENRLLYTCRSPP